MPSATSTLFLNVSAIKALCNGKTILNGTGSPSSLTGAENDFYLDTATYILYGPKNIATFWSASASLIGPAGVGGTVGSSYSAVSGFFFNPTAGFFTASALNITNPTQTGLVVNSTGEYSMIANTTGNTVASFSVSSTPILSLGYNTTTLSALSVVVGGRFSVTDNAQFDMLNGADFKITNLVHVSGSKVSIGTASVIDNPGVSAYKLIVANGNALFATPEFTVANAVDGVGLTVQAVPGLSSRVGINITQAQSYSLSSSHAVLTVNGSISSNRHISLSSIDIPAISGAGSPTTSNVPLNHFVMWYNTTNTTLCATYNIAGVIKAVPFLTV